MKWLHYMHKSVMNVNSHFPAQIIEVSGIPCDRNQLEGISVTANTKIRVN